MQALVAGDADGFYAAETEARRKAAMPPFGRLAAIIVSSEASEAAEARRIGRAAPESKHGRVRPRPRPARHAARPPSPPPPVHARRTLDVQDVIRDWLPPSTGAPGSA